MESSIKNGKDLLTIGTRNMYLFIFGKLFASFGSSIYAFSVSFYVLKVTGSVLNSSISLACGTLPRIILGPFSGVLSDRYDRKKIIIIADFLSAIIIGSACVVFYIGHTEIYVLYITTTLLAIVSTFYSTALSSAIPNMIDSERIQKVSSINQSIVSLSGMLGPVLGGILFAYLQMPFFMFLNAVTFFLSAITALFIRYNLYVSEKIEEKTSVASSLKEGFLYVKNHRFLFTLIKLAFILNFLFAALMVYLPYIVVIIRELGSEKLGLIEGAIALGMFIFSIILSTRGEAKNKNRMLFSSLAGMGVCIGVVGLTAHSFFASVSPYVPFAVLLVSCFVLGATMMLVNIPIFVSLQKETPDHYRGRVMAFLETGASAITPIGYIFFGAVANVISPLYSLIFISFIVIFFSIYFMKIDVLKLNPVKNFQA